MWTPMDLQWLKSNSLIVDFFINTMNWGGPDSAIQQMFTDGHHLGNHTIHHWHLAPGGGVDGIMHCMDSTCVDSEISGNETAINTIIGGSKPHLTRFRAPFGEPFQSGSASDLALVQPIVAQYAVEINWNFDSGDTAGITDGTALFNNVTMQIKTPGQGSWGIMLAHGVNQQTHDMLPMLIPYLQQNGFVLGDVEDVVCWMYGKHSWDIIPNRTSN
jgi:peptidoglycan/xylan/chitin deacetylase (PgdA/CDA1 family)